MTPIRFGFAFNPPPTLASSRGPDPRFGGPKTTGKQSGANIDQWARQYGLDAEQTEELREAVMDGKMGRGHHLSGQEVRQLIEALFGRRKGRED